MSVIVTPWQEEFSFSASFSTILEVKIGEISEQQNNNICRKVFALPFAPAGVSYLQFPGAGANNRV